MDTIFLGCNLSCSLRQVLLPFAEEIKITGAKLLSSREHSNPAVVSDPLRKTNQGYLAG